MGPVLVTGAAGFIGQHLVRALAARGITVRAVDVRERPPFPPAVAYTRADFREAVEDPALLRGIDTVFHLASMHLEVRASAADFEVVNVAGVRPLLAACARAGVRRVVHTSSVGIYGHIADPPARESSPFRPASPYEHSKLAGERVALEAAKATGLDLVILRPAWVYGPGCPRTHKLLRAVERRRFFYVDRGANLRHPIFIGDAVNAFLSAAAAEGIESGSAYIIAGPRAVTLRELVQTCASVLGVPPPRLSLPLPMGRALAGTMELAFGLVGRDAPFSRRSLAFFENDNAFDISAARADLDFDPQVDLHEGLARTLADEPDPAVALDSGGFDPPQTPGLARTG